MSRTFKISLEIRRNSEKFSAESVQNLMINIENSRFLQDFDKNQKKFDEFFQKISVSIGSKTWKSCRSRKMLKNEYSVAKIGFDTAENERSKVCQNFPRLAAACPQSRAPHGSPNFPPLLFDAEPPASSGLPRSELLSTG